MTYFHKRTLQKIATYKHAGDLVFESKLGVTQVDQESVPVVGNWQDYTGSKDVSSRSQQQYAGKTNKFQGTIAGDFGAREGNDNEVGQSSETYRRRQKLIYVEL